MSSCMKSYKAFDEELACDGDHEYTALSIYLPPSHSGFHLLETPSQSRWSPQISDFSHAVRGIGGGRSVRSTPKDLLADELEEMSGGNGNEPHARTTLMRAYLKRIASKLPPGDFAAVTEAAHRLHPIIYRIARPACSIIIIAWIVYFLRLFGVNYLGLLPQNFIGFIISLLFVIVHYRVGVKVWRKFMACLMQ